MHASITRGLNNSRSSNSHGMLTFLILRHKMSKQKTLSTSCHEVLHHQDVAESNMDNELGNDTNYVFLADDFVLED